MPFAQRQLIIIERAAAVRLAVMRRLGCSQEYYHCCARRRYIGGLMPSFSAYSRAGASHHLLSVAPSSHSTRR
jgi:hypothetical protein